MGDTGSSPFVHILGAIVMAALFSTGTSREGVRPGLVVGVVFIPFMVGFGMARVTPWTTLVIS